MGQTNTRVRKDVQRRKAAVKPKTVHVANPFATLWSFTYKKHVDTKRSTFLDSMHRNCTAKLFNGNNRIRSTGCSESEPEPII